MKKYDQKKYKIKQFTVAISWGHLNAQKQEQIIRDAALLHGISPDEIDYEGFDAVTGEYGQLGTITIRSI